MKRTETLTNLTCTSKLEYWIDIYVMVKINILSSRCQLFKQYFFFKEYDNIVQVYAFNIFTASFMPNMWPICKLFWYSYKTILFSSFYLHWFLGFIKLFFSTTSFSLNFINWFLAFNFFSLFPILNIVEAKYDA